MTGNNEESAGRMPPVFMFGYERSGTTLLSMVVGAHPDIAVPFSVTGLWYRYAGRLADYGNLSDRANLDALVADLLAEERIGLWDESFAPEDILEGLPATSGGGYADVIARFHQAYAERKHKRHWANLDIATLVEMDRVNRWFPDAKFVHIVRDCRDVALSHLTMPYGAANVLDCAEAWVARVGRNLKMGAMLPPERYHVMRYEDLILEPRATLERFCTFVGVPFSPQMLEYGAMVGEKVPEDKMWLWPQLDKPPDKSKAYGWRTRMSRSQRIVVEGVARGLLQELGYEVYDTVPKSVPAYLLEFRCLADRGGRLKRIKRKLGMGRKSTLERKGAGSKTRAPARPRERGKANTDTFTDLVETGVYTAGFDHADVAKDFVRQGIRAALAETETKSLKVLDCGCGTGAWLKCLNEILSDETQGLEVDYFGFDLSPGMVDLAREGLREAIPDAHLKVGDILDPAAYDFGRDGATFDLIFAYDVIQHLPRRAQLAACEEVVRHLSPQGTAIVFDHDKDTPFGRKMEIKKFLTKYLGVRLVPRYYCNAMYPALGKIMHTLAKKGSLTSRMLASSYNKHALILQPGRPAGHPQ